MNCLILNRESFELPADGWYQIAPLGVFPHEGAGVVQVVDGAACVAMANAFRAESSKPNFAGLLIDFDHFSLDGKQKSEAAGWIVDLEYRGPRDDGGNLKPEMGKVESRNGDLGSGGKTADGRPQTADLQDLATEGAKITEGDQRPTPNAQHPTSNNAGLWGKIRWSDAGEACVRGGRYRFLSPVWAKADCEDLGGGRLRPVRLLNAAVTNDPNIKGMVPLSNRAEGGNLKPEIGKTESRNGDRIDTVDLVDGGNGSAQPRPPDGIANAGGDGVKRFKWVLGDGDRNCPSCAALAGQVHTMSEWDAAGLRPGSEKLFCGSHCRCELVETDDPERGSLDGLRVRGDVMNRVMGKTTDCRPGGEDVRQQTADGRPNGIPKTEDGKLTTKGTENTKGDGREVSRGGAEDAEGGGRYLENNWSDAARAASLAVRRAKAAARKAARERTGVKASDPLGWFEDEGLSGMSPEAVDALTRQIREKLRRGDPLEPGEVGFLIERANKGYAGESDGDPVFNWIERNAMEADPETREDLEDRPEDVHDRAAALMASERSGSRLTPAERAFLETYRKVMGGMTPVAGIRTDEMRLMANAREVVQRAKARERGRRQTADLGTARGDARPPVVQAAMPGLTADPREG